MTSDLHIYFNDRDCPNTELNSNYVIRNNLGDGDKFWFKTLADLDLDQNNIFSYDKFYTYLLRPNGGNLCVYLEIYQNLREKIMNQGYDRIVAHNLDEGYLKVLKDLCDQYEVELVHNSSASQERSRNILSCSTLLLFIDLIFSLIFYGLSSPTKNENSEDPVLFIPFIGRTESMYPVFEAIGENAQKLMTRSLSSYLIRGEFFELYGETNKHSISEYANVSKIVELARSYLTLQYSLIKNDLEMSSQISHYLSEKHELEVSQTIDYACEKVLVENTDSLLKSALVEQAVREIDPGGIVVGGLSPKDLESLRTAEGLGASLHYIPHSITHEDEFIPPSTETQVYTTGTADNRFFEMNYEEEDLPILIPSGKPNMDEVVENLDRWNTEPKSDKIVIGTQAYDEWMRKQFLFDSLDALEECGYSQTVVVKIHPSEEVRFYRELIDKNGNTYEFDLVIREEGLHSLLSEADILLTINSNIGMEAILLDTYCITYNPFEPFTFRSSYIDGEAVPYTTNTLELKEELDGVISSQPVQTQKEHLDRCYTFGRSAERIAENILSDSSTTTSGDVNK